MTQIRIMALRHSAFYSPLLMTIAAGYLRDEGLEPVYTVATPTRTVPQSLSAGECHVAQSAVATSFAALEQGDKSDIVHFAQINGRDGFFIAAREPDDNFSWDKLQGKKVLVDHFFQPLAMLKYGLQKQGVQFDSLNVIDAGDVNSMDEAFRRGEGDYIHQQGPAPQQLQHDGVGHVVASVGSAVGPVAFSSLCCQREWLTTAMAQGFMRAYRKSLHYVIHAPADDIAASLSAADFFPAINADVLSETVKAYQHLGCWQLNPYIPTSSFESLLDVFLFNKHIQRRYNYSDIVDQSLCQSGG